MQKNVLRCFGALVLHDLRVANKGNATFLDLLEDYLISRWTIYGKMSALY
jgi:hypothetical protein